jgi:predicted  nucleic acid-binding Zn-ribbon protein
VDAQIAETAALRAGIVAETSSLDQRRSNFDTERNAYERERAALDEALQALEAAIAEFKQQREAEGDVKWVRDRVADAQEALAKLRAPKPKSFWTNFGFGRTDS